MSDASKTITTRFALGDVVTPIARSSEVVRERCKACDGAGEVALLKGGFVPCPNRYKNPKPCVGGFVSIDVISLWHVSQGSRGEIGSIEVRRVALKFQRNASPSETRYMLATTGVGSGQVWREEDLFSTDEEAQEACDERNAVLQLEAAHGR